MTHRISILTPREVEAWREELIELLFDAVDGGASVNFVWPMSREKAASWWAGALASHAAGERVIVVAEADGRLDGSVQILPASQENQGFRAEIAKLLVHRRARRQGLGAALMAAAEDEARRIGRTLLTLDTETGSAGDRLYARMGYHKFGEVPGYAMSADNSGPRACSFYFKAL